MLMWKSAQYQRSEFTDLFAYDWVVTLLKDIWRTQTPWFAGVLGVLYADDKPAAVHLGMRSGPLLHYWFPAYDPAMGKHSCGAALLLFMVQNAAEHGIASIDLGKGDDDYKLTFANDGVPVAEGGVETRRVAAAFRSGWQHARQWVRQSPLRAHVRAPIRWLRQMRDWLALR